jgi:3-deoxy-manno-octulosonate cytidylyltransferase (CMP-KDO synthetase)
MKTIVVIPARLGSTRLPRKLLLDLGGKSVIHRVYDQCRKARSIDSVVIAVDADELLEHCQKFSPNVVMTSGSHQSGTDRVAEASHRLVCDVVINVQGDEPFVRPDQIDGLAAAFLSGGPEVHVASAMHRLRDEGELASPGVVKVVVDHRGDALYFSRAPIPFNRDALPFSDVLYYRHIGMYGYRSDFLRIFPQLPPSRLESLERLEQLRILENGYRIRMIETSPSAGGIDTIDDYQRALATIHEHS